MSESIELSRIEGSGQRNAMTNDAGDWFYPDSPSDASWFAREHEAWFIRENLWTRDDHE